jgi:predicted RNA-binding protein with PUA-like domain
MSALVLHPLLPRGLELRHWLLKSEPSEFGIDDLARSPKQTAPWTGIRNYQARNFLRDESSVGDLAFFYHSSCPQPGIAGLMRIASKPYADPTQFDPDGPYFDPKSKEEQPRWTAVNVTLVKKTRLLGLDELRRVDELSDMRLLARGNRLSVMPVSVDEFEVICKILNI